jgi:osmotically-inducible protein OsmY
MSPRSCHGKLTRLGFSTLSACVSVLCWRVVAADEPAKPRSTVLAPIVISGQRLPPNASDEEVTRAVVESIAQDRWIFADHVTITTRNGVVYVQGHVSDEWDLYHILDRARKIAGRRKIVNDLEFDMVGDDSD